MWGGIRTVDLSADYRLAKDVYERSTACVMRPTSRPPTACPNSIVTRSGAHRRKPGCFPTGATLAAAPLAKSAHTIVYDSKTGATGAGTTPSATTHYPNVGDNLSAYKWTGHRHLAEMKQEAARLGSAARCYFTPHLLPVNRGILTTAHILLREPMEQEEVEALYQKFYREFFVRYQKPTLAAVRGTNFCDVAVESEGDRVVAISAIDNLVKGASGQAIQNMNLMCGFAEDDGLRFAGMLP